MEPGRVVSSAENPEQAAQVAQDLLSDKPRDDFEPIVLQPPPDATVTLPGGLLEPDGSIITDAEVRELTGADEEALSKADAGRKLDRFIEVTLTRAVVRVGHYEPPSKDVLGALLIGDRDMLMLAIRKATYGNNVDYSTRCPECQEVLDIVLDVDDDIPIRKLENPEQRRFEVPLRKGGAATVRLPVGEDQNAVLTSNKNVAETNTLLLSRCLIAVNGVPVTGGSARSLGMADRKAILDFFIDQQPGPRFEEVKAACPMCEKDVPLMLDWADLFRG